MDEEVGRKLTKEKLEELSGQLAPVMRRIAHEAQMKKLENDLVEEVHYWNEVIKSNDSQYNRRAFIRALMAYVEGSSYAIRETLLISDGSSLLDVTERAFLSGKRFSLQKNGTIKAETSGFHSTAPLMLLTMRCYAKANEIEHDLDLGGNLWEDVVATFQLRNTLSHPKDPTSIVVSDEAVLSARYAYSWYYAVLNGMHLKVLTSVQDRMTAMGDQVTDEETEWGYRLANLVEMTERSINRGVLLP